MSEPFVISAPLISSTILNSRRSNDRNATGGAGQKLAARGAKLNGFGHHMQATLSANAVAFPIRPFWMRNFLRADGWSRFRPILSASLL